MEVPMAPSATQLKRLEDRYRRLARQILDLGFSQPGSVVSRRTYCQTPGCRCHADPPQLHGPYWQWTRYDSGRTVTRRLTEGQARIYRELVANRRRLTDILVEMDKVAAQAAEILAQQSDKPATTNISK